MGRRLRQPVRWRVSRAWATVVPTVLTLVLGAVFLGRASMWTDEAITWFVSSQPVSQLVRNSAHTDVMFLPYYLFMHFWLGISHSLWWMRLPSLLGGAAAVQALVLLARRWLPLGWSVLAGFLLALNPLFATFTIQARPYPIVALFAVLSTAALVNAIARGGRRRWALYSLASACMLLTHLLAAFVLVAHLGGAAIARRRSAWSGMLSAIVCAGIVAIPLAVLNAREVQEEEIPRSILHTFQYALSAVAGGRAEAIALVTCGIIVAASLARMPRGSDRALGPALFLAWGAMPGLLMVAVGFLRPLFMPRYEVMSVPGIAFTEVYAAWRVSTFLAAKARVSPWRACVAAALISGAACVAAFALLCATGGVLLTRVWSEDFRSAAAELNGDLAERPAPIAVFTNVASVGFSYYETSPELTREMNRIEYQKYNRGFIGFWSGGRFASGGYEPRQLASVISWPAGAKPGRAPENRCAAGWAIGTNFAPSKTLIIDGSSCLVGSVHHYGSAWVAPLSGVRVR